jgi:hypothetical protein
VGALLGGPAPAVHHDLIMRQPAIHYVETSLPEHMTIADYRRSRPRKAPKRGLRGVIVLRPRFAV